MISNVSTIVTKTLLPEFFILNKSLELFNPGTKIIVLCDEESAKQIHNLLNPNIIVINELKNLDYEDISKRGKSFLDLVLRKCDVIEYALHLYNETLFVDSDIVFLNQFDVNTDKQLILSRHHIFMDDEAKFGKYNVGYLLIKDLSFPQWLKEVTLKRSKYYEQEGLIHAEKEFDIETFSMNHNFGWWRLYQCDDSKQRYKKFTSGSSIYWDGEPLVSVHVHMASNGFKDETNDSYANFILKLLLKSRDEKHQKLYQFIKKIRSGWSPAKPKIIVPHPTITDHVGDTFRELVDVWVEEGLCVKEYTKKSKLVWMNEIGDVLLYDRPTLEWLGKTKYNFGLFGNYVPNFEHTSSWIFWGRRPTLLKKIIEEIGVNSIEKRDIESIFLGKIENNVQKERRTNYDWSKSIEIFEMPINGEYKYSQWEYLQMLNRSKFGLCLPGYGGKCNREIELLALGVIPLITEGVDLTYYNQLQEGIHYLKVENPEEVKAIIETISNEEWCKMSLAGRQWYECNCSPLGSFKTTLNIVKNKYGDYEYNYKRSWWEMVYKILG